MVALALLMAVMLRSRGNSVAVIARANSRSGAALMSKSLGVNFNSLHALGDRRSICKAFQDPIAVGRLATDRDTARTSAPPRSAAFAILMPKGEVAPMITTRRADKGWSVCRPSAIKKCVVGDCGKA